MASDEDVIKSITFGQKTIHDKFKIQALCAALKSPRQLEILLSHLGKDPKLPDVTDKILAFRTEDEEGYDDGSTLAAGEKLLHMLERMNVDNIVVIIFLWDYGYIGKPGTAMFKVILDKARDLLLSIHAKVFGNLDQAKTNRPMLVNQNFMFDQLPDPKEGVLENRKYNRPRHFMNDAGIIPSVRLYEEPSVTEAELYGAINQVENALRTLSQSDIIDLRNQANNQQILKILQMVCLLKGYRTCTWGNIKDMLDSRTLKLELGMIDVFKLTKTQIQMVRQIITDNPKITVESMTKISIAAATLLSWVEGIITWHAGRKLIGRTPENFSETSPDLNQKEKNMIKNLIAQSSEGRASQKSSAEGRGSQKSSEGRASQRSDNRIHMSIEPPIDEESEDEAKPKIETKKINPEFEEKLKKTRELKIEQEERIERVLKTRLEEVNFEGEKVELTDEDIMKYLSSENLGVESTPVLMALVDKLKERRITPG